MTTEEIGVVGLGRMGNLALPAIEPSFRVAGLTRESVPQELRDGGVVTAVTRSALVAQLHAPRKIFFYVYVPGDRARTAAAEERPTL
jgi:6-phosphogluconate dehydrogenase (decarboxylating)